LVRKKTAKLFIYRRVIASTELSRSTASIDRAAQYWHHRRLDETR
jgi:hypothetical protein